MERKGIVSAAIVILLGLCCGSLRAEPTTANQAESVVTGWLKADGQPLGAALGQRVGKVQTFTNDVGDPIYYVVYLQPSGFVIVPADDLVEPIIGFADDGTYDPSLDNPLGALVTNDLKGRIEAVRDVQNLQPAHAIQTTVEAQTKWQQLQSQADEVAIMGLGSVSDVRVAPLIKSKWYQETCCIADPCACYNYYTPPFAEGSKYNYPSGCVATALAQIMRCHQHPTSGVGTDSFTIRVNDVNQTRSTRGGDGSGGGYNWGQMVLVPGCGTSETQRKAIGALCHDAGVGISNLIAGEYTKYNASTTIAYTHSATVGLISTFKYGNAVMGYKNGYNIGAGLINMINPSLDYGHPVYLGIKNGGGHAVVCDGYGYNAGTLYHHINMGWGGSQDAWYLLPDITTSYDTVYETIYNISPWEMAEIISGRVTTPDGTPIVGAEIHGESNDCGIGSIGWTDANGIYAIDAESDCNYTVSVSKSGYFFSNQEVEVGHSVDLAATSGNRWGIDFVCIPPQITSITPASGSAGTYVKIEGQYFGDAAGSVIFSCLPAGTPWGEQVQWSNTVIYCRAPEYVMSGDVVVRTAVGVDSDGVHFDVNDLSTIYVDINNTTKIENGSTEYPFSKVQRGIYAATLGDTVIVEIGTYCENVDFDGKSITVTGTGPEEPDVVAATIIDGNQVGTVVTFASGEDVNSVLTGFTITDGNSSNGGGIRCVGSSPTINYCVIKNNSNPDSAGGGMYNSWADETGSNPTLNKCTFANNTSGSRDGAMHNYESSPTLKDCVFVENSALYGGGAIGNWSDSNAIMVNCLFISNSARDQYGDGGAIYNSYSCPKIYNCKFHGNSVQYRGGAVYSFYCDSTLTITNSVFSGNSADEDGGGLFNSDGGPTLTNCTFSRNSAGDKGGAIYNSFNDYAGNNTALASCILWANGSDEMYDYYSTTVVSYSDIKGGWTGATNIDQDPNFAREPNDGGDGWGDDPCTAAVDEGANDDYGDLHITPGSRCIDAGDNTAVPDDVADLDDDSNTTEPVPWDFDGHPRFVDDPCSTNTGNGTPPIVDMGADEFPYLGDLNFSGCVNFVDHALFAKQWWKTACGGCGGADLTGDGNVDWNDVRRLAASWLAGCAP